MKSIPKYFFFLCCLILGWGCTTPISTCQKTEDCGASQTCENQKCVPSQNIEKKQEQAKESTQEKDASEPKKEAPPLPDIDLKEGTIAPPEELIESILPEKQANLNRKVGETCDPSIGALPKDRCAKDSFCVAPQLGAVGVCLKACDPNASICTKGQKCGEVYSRENKKLLGHACGKEVNDYYACTHGVYCKKGSQCVNLGKSEEGYCFQVCKENSDCGSNGWCVQSKDFSQTSTPVFVCNQLSNTVGDYCFSRLVCGTGLGCRGTGLDRKCLQDCSNGLPCPTNHRCVVSPENTTTSYCYPLSKVKDKCHSTLQCPDDSHCLSFGSTFYSSAYFLCLQDCSQTGCASGETCKEINGKKVCLQEKKEGESCFEHQTCATGLVCRTFSSHSAVCVQDCSQTNCPSQQKCVETTYSNETTKSCLQDCSQSTCPSTTSCQTVQQDSVCFPLDVKTSGLLGQNETCHPYAGATPQEQCKSGLSCLSTAGGYRCFQYCDASNPSCPTNQKCVQLSSKTALCGEEKKEGEACDLSQSQICSFGLRCEREYGFPYGTCVPEGTQKTGETCASDVLACSGSGICSGSPLSPFRWTCRESCDPQAPVCGNNQTCVSLNDGGACFDTCDANSTCSERFHQCEELQTKKICQ